MSLNWISVTTHRMSLTNILYTTFTPPSRNQPFVCRYPLGQTKRWKPACRYIAIKWKQPPCLIPLQIKSQDSHPDKRLRNYSNFFVLLFRNPCSRRIPFWKSCRILSITSNQNLPLSENGHHSSECNHAAVRQKSTRAYWLNPYQPFNTWAASEMSKSLSDLSNYDYLSQSPRPSPTPSCPLALSNIADRSSKPSN